MRNKDGNNRFSHYKKGAVMTALLHLPVTFAMRLALLVALPLFCFFLRRRRLPRHSITLPYKKFYHDPDLHHAANYNGDPHLHPAAKIPAIPFYSRACNRHCQSDPGTVSNAP